MTTWEVGGGRWSVEVIELDDSLGRKSECETARFRGDMDRRESDGVRMELEEEYKVKGLGWRLRSEDSKCGEEGDAGCYTSTEHKSN